MRTDWGRAVWLSTSNDFMDWTEAELIFESDIIDENNRRRRVRRIVEDPAYLTPPFVDDGDYIAEIYKMAILPYEGLYIGFPVLLNPSGSWMGKNQTGVNQTELAVSRDLRTWTRVANRDLFLDVLPWDGETYDTAQVIPCGTPVVREDVGQIWVYYDTCRFRARRDDVAEEHRHYFEEDLNAVALAKVRLDGFVSLDADRRGTLLTRPFDLRGGRLFLNADASGGRIAAEVVDALTGDPLPGLSGADCVPMGGDSLRGRRELGFRRRADPPRAGSGEVLTGGSAPLRLLAGALAAGTGRRVRDARWPRRGSAFGVVPGAEDGGRTRDLLLGKEALYH